MSGVHRPFAPCRLGVPGAEDRAARTASDPHPRPEPRVIGQCPRGRPGPKPGPLSSPHALRGADHGGWSCRRATPRSTWLENPSRGASSLHRPAFWSRAAVPGALGSGAARPGGRAVRRAPPRYRHETAPAGRPLCTSVSCPRSSACMISDAVASLMIVSGAGVKLVQQQLRQRTATLTLDRYAHLFPDELDALSGALDGLRIRTPADSLRTPSSTVDVPRIGDVL